MNHRKAHMESAVPPSSISLYLWWTHRDQNYMVVIFKYNIIMSISTDYIMIFIQKITICQYSRRQCPNTKLATAHCWYKSKDAYIFHNCFFSIDAFRHVSHHYLKHDRLKCLIRFISKVRCFDKAYINCKDNYIGAHLKIIGDFVSSHWYLHLGHWRNMGFTEDTPK